MRSALLTLLSLMFGVTLSRFQSSLSFSAFHLDFAKEGASGSSGLAAGVQEPCPCEAGAELVDEDYGAGRVHPLGRLWAQGRQSLSWEQWVLRAGGWEGELGASTGQGPQCAPRTSGP